MASPQWRRGQRSEGHASAKRVRFDLPRVHGQWPGTIRGAEPTAGSSFVVGNYITDKTTLTRLRLHQTHPANDSTPQAAPNLQPNTSFMLRGGSAETMRVLAGAAHAGPLAPQPRVVAKYDRNFIERSGAQTLQELLDTGIIRYFFTGGQDLLVLVNGRPYSSTGGNLESVPLSAVERIEVVGGDSLGSIGGTVRGALNIVLRKDLDGFEARTVTRAPGRDGGDAWQGSAFWGGAFGKGRMTLGVDVVDRQEIPGSERVHSRSEWVDDGEFNQAKNVSVSGNTAFVVPGSVVGGEFVRDEITVDGEQVPAPKRSVALGECNPAQGYVRGLSNPPGITSGDQGCGFAYGNIWWDTRSREQQSAILNLDHPLGDDADLHLDVNVTQYETADRWAPSVDVFSITPNSDLIAAINAAATEAGSNFVADDQDRFSIGHRLP